MSQELLITGEGRLLADRLLRTVESYDIVRDERFNGVPR